MLNTIVPLTLLKVSENLSDKGFVVSDEQVSCT
jgi:hypothetical protein